MIDSTSGFLLARNVYLVGGALLVVLIPLLYLLNRRLHLFTRGTITFMLTVSLVTAVLSFIELGSNVKNAEIRARQTAELNRVREFTREWIEERAEVQPVVRNSMIDESAKKEFADILAEIKQVLNCPEDGTVANGALRLVSITIESSWRYTADWRTVIYLERQGQLIRLTTYLGSERIWGNMTRFRPADHRIEDAKVDYRLKSDYRNANCYVNPEFKAFMK